MLNSLVIKNFRLLEDFAVEKLGRVNLIVGKNNSGKSTVLEALRIYAGNANLSLLNEIAISHDEKYLQENVKSDASDKSKAFEDFFTGRQFPDDDKEIVIGESITNEQVLRITYRISIDFEEIKKPPEEITSQKRSGFSDSITKLDYINRVKERGADFVTKREILILIKNSISFSIYLSNELLTSRHFSFHHELVSMTCSFIPTQFISIEELAKEWGNIKVAGAQYEKIVSDALKIILPEYEELFFHIESKNSLSSTTIRHIPMIRISNQSKAISLKSLGDGMIRVLQLALKLVSAKDGFLLIDEFENGLHYSTQEKIWTLLFEMAERLNIQVFATTHSWDCIEAFTKVALKNETTEGVLFRMGRSAKKSNQGQIIATVFDKEKLARMTQADIEIR